MPELPEVETVARDLRGLIVGALIVDAWCNWPRMLRSGTPEGLAGQLAGRVVEVVGRRGKQLRIELSGDGLLTIHLKMTGQLFVVPAELAIDRHVHFALAFADGRELRFRDIRKFGRVGIYVPDVAGVPSDDPFAAVGPEPLDPAFRVADFRHRLRARRGRLKPLLLDQSFLAGIGNIYADEALWLARLHPLRSAASLRPPDEGRLYRAIRSVLAEAVERRGSSVDDYTAPDGDGTMQERLQVYGRAGSPCPRCGRPIRRIVVGGRATHFCSWCQRLPAAQRPAVAAILRGSEGRPAARRGPRWTEAAAPGTLGLTTREAAAAELRARTERVRRAAAARRAAARQGAAGRA
jgi:formamidopyrimidine-DNA glycosylase